LLDKRKKKFWFFLFFEICAEMSGYGGTEKQFSGTLHLFLVGGILQKKSNKNLTSP
jgi:hypothetical protein